MGFEDRTPPDEQELKELLSAIPDKWRWYFEGLIHQSKTQTTTIRQLKAQISAKKPS